MKKTVKKDNATNKKILKVEVMTDSGRKYETASLAQFNNGYSHIIMDDGCYQIVNGNKISSHIFAEAWAVMKQLGAPSKLKQAQSSGLLDD